VSNLLRLTALPKAVQDYVLDGAIDMGHARALLALPAAQQTGVAVRVVNGALSVRETERLVHGMLNPAKRAARKRAHARDADTIRLENELAETLGAKVAIEAKAGGKGRVVIAYSSLEQLDGIVAKLRP
jgi:ParB family chromosome partitioning protein